MPEPVLVVERVGPLALLQDLGRPGHGRLGVPPSGAVDRPALRLANRLVGNAEGEAVVEVLLGGLTVRADAATVVAVTGAPAPLTVAGRSAPMHAAVLLAAGEALTLGRPVLGLRSYLAVRGGLAVPRTLGSASTDVASGLGPPPLRQGQRLPVGTSAPGPVRGSDVAGVHAGPPRPVVLRAVVGPRDDWFGAEALRLLGTSAWQVTPDSDRVGVRLGGPVLPRGRTEELLSEGVVRGSVQVPASGQPLVFLADHPTTGGYPVVAVVVDEDTDLLAQVVPGEAIRFSLRRAGWLPEAGRRAGLPEAGRRAGTG
ncbi:MAG TPA: biotin-dependent carboxyltransferase family protein [Intrasporangium sp.]|uniref:5-oxoprolinase subunit C family protein n=1 Tax=Intrasporangium sp. TaxID=1925024 RepID=UPI002D769E3A|nr:biotin-dependent carboxyltransferase family protein [Intrasporangium sp.]HET7399923.1 biotin-dependent carboxyltransferase family protein [Intrasporangium sp.]